MNWLEENGSDIEKLKILYYDKNYRGVHAKKKIYVTTIISLK